jgi:hypothetical protein
MFCDLMSTEHQCDESPEVDICEIKEESVMY